MPLQLTNHPFEVMPRPPVPPRVRALAARRAPHRSIGGSAGLRAHRRSRDPDCSGWDSAASVLAWIAESVVHFRIALSRLPVRLRPDPRVARRREGLWSASGGEAMGIDDWFLTAAERGNSAFRLPPWSAGNRVVARVHGCAYFARLVEEVRALRSGDHLFFTDWRGDAHERLCPEGPTVGELFGDAARRGVIVKGLMWRSHTDRLSYSEQENRGLGEAVAEAGGEVLLDQRIRFAGSHHQKLVVVRHPGDPDRDVA